jgi:hypothetical protein
MQRVPPAVILAMQERIIKVLAAVLGSSVLAQDGMEVTAGSTATAQKYAVVALSSLLQAKPLQQWHGDQTVAFVFRELLNKTAPQQSGAHMETVQRQAIKSVCKMLENE